VKDVGGETRGITEPISPELVLIDPELAASARAILPDYSLDYVRPAPRPVARAEEEPAPVAVSEPQAARPEWVEERDVQLDPWERKAPSWRTRATVGLMVAAVCALAVLVVLNWRSSADEPSAAVADGASEASGTGPKVPRVPETTTAGGTTVPDEPPPESSERTQPTATTPERPPPPPPPPPPPRLPGPPPVLPGRPPSNVLGVVVTAGSHTVTLRWQRPAGAVDVIIVRRPGRHGAESTVYEGKRNTYVDRNVRDRVAYRYLIISRDGSGRLSSGVPTVVTPGGRS
jgi:hypothetical protein